MQQIFLKRHLDSLEERNERLKVKNVQKSLKLESETQGKRQKD